MALATTEVAPAFVLIGFLIPVLGPAVLPGVFVAITLGLAAMVEAMVEGLVATGVARFTLGATALIPAIGAVVSGEAGPGATRLVGRPDEAPAGAARLTPATGSGVGRDAGGTTAVLLSVVLMSFVSAVAMPDGCTEASSFLFLYSATLASMRFTKACTSAFPFVAKRG